MTIHKNSSRPNGHPGPNGRPNGHGPASAERGGVPALRDHAASDDASGVSVASVTALPAAASLPSQASTVREAYAEVAPPAPNETAQRLSGRTSSSTRARRGASTGADQKDEKEVPPGKYPLPDNPGEFVEEIHRKIDLTEVWHNLLRHEDDKIRQRAVERLTDLFYKGDPASTGDPQQVIFDLPRPKRD